MQFRPLGLAAAAVCALSAGARAQSGLPYPRLANMYLQGSVNPADIPALARWDVLILDSVWTRSQLQQLRALNPNIKLYFYVCAYCSQAPPPGGHPWATQNYNYAQTHDLWWRNWNQTIASDWPGTRLMNITDYCWRGPEGTWREYMGARVERLVRDTPELDGVFFDNFWKTIGWEQGGTIQVDSDCNPTHNPAGCNGVMDSDAVADTLWNRALRTLAKDVRTRFDAVGGPRSIISNSSSDYFPWLNGSLFEYFPNGSSNPDPGNPYGYNWNQEMLGLPGGYLVAPYRTTPYRVSVLNADWQGTWAAPVRSPDFERHKRFTLASALMGDGYYSLDAAETGHGSIWWEPEYDHGGRGRGYLGYPTGAMQRIGVPNGPEAIVNGGFDATLVPWQSLAVGCTGSLTRDTSVYHTGPASARLTVSNVGTGGSFKLYQNVPVVAGRAYTLRFWTRASTSQQIQVHLYSTSCPSVRCLTDTWLSVGTGWTLQEVSFTSTGTTPSAGFNLFVTTNGTLWVDDMSLRDGDTSVYRRDFDDGIVILNYTNTAQTVSLGDSFDRLSIPGSSVYNGARVTSEVLAPSDARILLRVKDPSPAPPPPPPQARLYQNEPNPFNPSTRIRFQLAQDEHVKLEIFDLAGRLVRTLVNRQMSAGGQTSVSWNGTDRWGQRVRSGVYFYRLTTPSFTETRKLTVLM